GPRNQPAQWPVVVRSARSAQDARQVGQCGVGEEGIQRGVEVFDRITQDRRPVILIVSSRLRGKGQVTASREDAEKNTTIVATEPAGVNSMRHGTRIKRINYAVLALFFAAAASGVIRGDNAARTTHTLAPAHPRVWEDEAIAALELPLADPA